MIEDNSNINNSEDDIYFPFISIDKETEDEVKDNNSSHYSQITNGNNYYYEEDEDSLLELSPNCNHKYFSGIAESSKLVCDTCNEIIGEQRFEFTYSRESVAPPASQYSIYKIYPYPRKLIQSEIQDLK